MYGIQRIHLLRNVMILAGAGVGGGSLNYANTLYVPPEPFFNDPQWKHITDWRAELMPHYDQAQRMLGVVENPTFTDADKVMKEVADDMGVGDTFVRDAGRGLLRAGRHEDAGQDRARPVLRRRGPGAHRLHRMRLVHDRLPLRRQEHAGEELPRPGGIRWGTSASDDHRDRLQAAVRRAVGGQDRAHRPPAAPEATDFHRHASGPRRGHVRHAEAAVQDARRRQPAEAVGQARRAHPHQLRVDRRRRAAGGARRPRPHPRRGDHVVDPSDLRHPHRAGPLRQGLQRDGPAADADDRRRRAAGHRRPAVAAAAGPGGRGPEEACCGCSTPVSGASGP